MKIVLEFDETKKLEIIKELTSVSKPNINQGLQTKIGLAIIADSRTAMKIEVQKEPK